MRTTVSTKGQIVLPAEIRREDDIKTGQEFQIERIDRGEYLLKRTDRPRNKGLVKLLLSCPVKNWFQPLDRTETNRKYYVAYTRMMYLVDANVLSEPTKPHAISAISKRQAYKR